jgi:copper(I)-binding protein
MRPIASLFGFLLGIAAATSATAQVAVKDAWVRATVPQQKATGAFMQLTAAQDSKLVSVSSSAVPVAEVHEMKMQDGVMKMRPLPSLALPAGKAVALTPGGYHVMLMGLKQQLKAGDSVPLTLVFESQGGKREAVEVQAEVRALGTAAPKADEHGDHKH